ncbi:MAG: hypothetical protein GWP06_06575 [Actinobacteria bacterium]|nr:hypothetical protein [Actinomycetota bacterium]
MKTLTILLLLLGMLVASTICPAQGMSFSGDVTGVSTYVWRGVKQYNGAALQGTASFGFKSLSFGVWTSSINFGDDTEAETDPFVELSLPTGSIASSIGATIYTYDLFQTFNADADMEFELFARAGIGPLGLAFYFVPSQSSTTNNLNSSDYWIEASLGMEAAGAEWSAMFAYGTYSSRFLATPKSDAVTNIVLSVSKSLLENLNVSYNYSIGTDSQMENIFWMGLGYSF